MGRANTMGESPKRARAEARKEAVERAALITPENTRVPHLPYMPTVLSWFSEQSIALSPQRTRVIGALFLLMTEQWNHDSIPADAASQARLIQEDIGFMKSIRPVLRGYFKPEYRGSRQWVFPALAEKKESAVQSWNKRSIAGQSNVSKRKDRQEASTNGKASNTDTATPQQPPRQSVSKKHRGKGGERSPESEIRPVSGAVTATPTLTPAPTAASPVHSELDAKGTPHRHLAETGSTPEYWKWVGQQLASERPNAFKEVPSNGDAERIALSAWNCLRPGGGKPAIIRSWVRKYGAVSVVTCAKVIQWRMNDGEVLHVKGWFEHALDMLDRMD